MGHSIPSRAGNEIQDTEGWAMPSLVLGGNKRAGCVIEQLTEPIPNNLTQSLREFFRTHNADGQWVWTVAT